MPACAYGHSDNLRDAIPHIHLALRRMSSILPSPQKMADTSKDELLVGEGIRHITATSQYKAHSNEVRNIVSAVFHLLARKNI